MDTAKLMSLVKQKKSAMKSRDKTLKPNPGANRYVILQGWRKGEEHVYWHDFGQHFIKNASGELQAVYVCTDKTHGTPCPVCEGLQKAIRSAADDDMVNLLKESTSGQSFLLNVLALDSAEPDTPQILALGKLAFMALSDLIEEWGAAIFDPSNPQVVVINRTGKGFETKYTVQASPKQHPMPAGTLTKLNNLDEYVRQESEEGQRRAISAINNVAGLLSAPGTGSDRPRTASLPRPAAASADFSDADAALTELEERGRPQDAAPTSGKDVALDEELEALLGGTGTNG